MPATAAPMDESVLHCLTYWSWDFLVLPCARFHALSQMLYFEEEEEEEQDELETDPL
jgi:hypothetical protein